MKTALALQLLLLIYHQATTLIDLYPFNGARYAKPAERFAEAGFNLALMIWAPIGFAFGRHGLMQFGSAYYFILFACELATWVVPYAFGASPRWQAAYGRLHGSTVTLLPRRGENPTPNLEHLILMALTLATAVATFAAYRSVENNVLRGWPVEAGFGLVLVSGIAITHWNIRGMRAEVRGR